MSDVLSLSSVFLSVSIFSVFSFFASSSTETVSVFEASEALLLPHAVIPVRHNARIIDIYFFIL